MTFTVCPLGAVVLLNYPALPGIEEQEEEQDGPWSGNRCKKTIARIFFFSYFNYTHMHVGLLFNTHRGSTELLYRTCKEQISNSTLLTVET